MALQCLSVKLVPDVSGRVCEPCRGNGSTEHAQRYATLCVCVCVLNWVTKSPQHMEKFSRSLEMTQCQDHKAFLAQNIFWRQNPYWSLASQRTTISNTDRWQHNMCKRSCSIWSKINSQTDCWWSELEPGNSSFDTDWWNGDKKNLCQDGAQESHRATAGCAVERSFWHSNALRWYRSLLTHLISHLANSFYFKK